MRTAEDVLERIKVALGVPKDADLSRALDIPKTTISGWKQRNAVPYELCVQIADQKGASLDWLLTGQGQFTRTTPTEAGPQEPALSREEQEVLAIYRALDDDARREIQAVARERKRLRDVERQLQEIRSELAAAKRWA